MSPFRQDTTFKISRKKMYFNCYIVFYAFLCPLMRIYCIWKWLFSFNMCYSFNSLLPLELNGRTSEIYCLFDNVYNIVVAIVHTAYLIWNGRDIFFTSSIFTLALLMRFFSFNAAENKIYFDKKRKLCLCLDLMSHDYKRNCKLFTCWIRRRFVLASMVNFGAV